MEGGMKIFRLMCLVIVLLGIIPSSTWARGGHHHHHYRGWGSFGLGLGLGYGLGGYGYRGFGGYRWGYPGYRFGYGGYYSPYYAYPPVVAVPSTPPVYIQQGTEQQSGAELPDNYWYYCRKPEGYFPHVRKCPDGWMKVVPQLSPTQ